MRVVPRGNDPAEPGRSRLFAVLAVLAVAVASPLAAQEASVPGLADPGPDIARAPQSSDGFLFRAPRVTIGLRTGFNVARAGGGLFDFVTDNLTVDRFDFSAFTIGGDLAVNLSGPVDLLLGVLYARTSVGSEFREYVDQDDLPITQQTTFSQTPLTLGVRAYLAPRGRQIGRFVWIPTRMAPYVGAGAGMVHYTFEQVGSFVDFQDLSIFDDTFESRGWSPLGMVMAGVDFSLSPRVLLNGDVRYTFSSGDLGRDFVSFSDGIDLSGLQLSIGVHFRL